MRVTFSQCFSFHPLNLISSFEQPVAALLVHSRLVPYCLHSVAAAVQKEAQSKDAQVLGLFDFLNSKQKNEIKILFTAKPYFVASRFLREELNRYYIDIPHIKRRDSDLTNGKSCISNISSATYIKFYCVWKQKSLFSRISVPFDIRM